MSSWQYLPSGMLFHRRMLIRASLFLNFCVLTYVALHAAQGTTPSGDAMANSVSASASISAESFNLPSGVQIVYSHAEAPEAPAPAPLPVSVTSLHLSTEMDTESSATSEMNSSNASNNNNPTLPESTDPPHPAELKLPCQVAIYTFS